MTKFRAGDMVFLPRTAGNVPGSKGVVKVVRATPTGYVARVLTATGYREFDVSQLRHLKPH